MRFSLLPLALIPHSLLALVSIAPVDVGTNPGFSGHLYGSLTSKSGNTEKEDYALGGRLQYDEGSYHLSWGTVTYNYGTSSGVKNEDRLYAHLRHIRAIDHNDWCWELFAQSEQNKFLKIQDRTLGGVNVRWRFFNSKEWGKGYVGIGGFSEHVTYVDSLLDPSETNQRINSYIAYTKGFEYGSKLSYVGYYQPKFSDTADYATSQTIELIVPIYGKINLNLTAMHAYDSRPAVGVKVEDTAFKTGVIWEF